MVSFNFTSEFALDPRQSCFVDSINPQYCLFRNNAFKKTLRVLVQKIPEKSLAWDRQDTNPVTASELAKIVQWLPRSKHQNELQCLAPETALPRKAINSSPFKLHLRVQWRLEIAAIS